MLYHLYYRITCVRFITWMEEVLFKVPVGDLLFGTLGLIIGLIVAYLIGFAIEQCSDTGHYRNITNYFVYYSWVFRVSG